MMFEQGDEDMGDTLAFVNATIEVLRETFPEPTRRSAPIQARASWLRRAAIADRVLRIARSIDISCFQNLQIPVIVPVSAHVWEPGEPVVLYEGPMDVQFPVSEKIMRNPHYRSLRWEAPITRMIEYEDQNLLT